MIVALVLAFVILVPTDARAWYDAAFGFRRSVTVDAAQVPNSDRTDFPVLVSRTDPSFRLVASGGRVEHPSGWDIVFVDSTDTQPLPHEIESYDGTSGEIVMWVTLPTVSASTDTRFFLYYGNAGIAASPEDPDGVWSNGYEAVWHLDSGLMDSTPNGRHGTDNGTVDTAGQVARGRDFTPISDVQTGAWSVSSSALTMQAWVRFDDFDQDDPRALSKAQASSPEDHVFLLGISGPSEDRPRMRIKTGTNDATGTTTLVASTGSLTAGTWYHLAGTYNGTQMKLLTDGVGVDSTAKTGALRQNAWDVWIGNNPNNTDPTWASLDGRLDEVRISSVARSADWLRTEYNNQSAPGAFLSVAAEESRLDLVKRAFLLDGTPVPSGTTVPRGTRIRYLLYVNNPGAARPDASIQDILDPAFAYQAGTARIDTTVASCASADCTALEEGTIFAAVAARPVESDAVDADAVSFDVGTDTIHAGDEVWGNSPLDISAATVAALLFDVKVR